MEASTSKTSSSTRDDRREVDGASRRDRDRAGGEHLHRRDHDDDDKRDSRRERDRDDDRDRTRRRDDDREHRHRSDRDRRGGDRDKDGDRRRDRRPSPSGRDADRERVGDRDDRRRDYGDRNGGDRRRERDYDDDRRYRRDDEREHRRRRSSRSPMPASSSRRDEEERYSRRDTRDAPDRPREHGLPPLQTDAPASTEEVKQFVPPTKESIMAQRAKAAEAAPAKRPMRLIEVIANDRLGGKVRVKCSPKDTVGDLKKLIAVQKGTKPEKIVLKKWYTIFKDHIALEDYEIHDGMSLEMS